MSPPAALATSSAPAIASSASASRPARRRPSAAVLNCPV